MQPVNDFEGMETDAQFIEDWQNSEYVKPSRFTAFTLTFRDYDDGRGDAEEIERRWKAWFGSTGQILDIASKRELLSRMPYIPTNGDPLE